MSRVSTNMAMRDMQYQMRLRDSRSSQLQSQMGKGKRIINLRDDPMAASQSIRMKSASYKTERFLENSEEADARLRLAESALNESLDIVHRLREISLQGAQGTYTGDELKIMAVEVNEMLNELANVANSKDGKGESLFAGTATDSPAFLSMMGRREGISGDVITSVKYSGSSEENRIEIAEGVTVAGQIAGNRAFWAQQQELIGGRDISSLVVPRNTTITIDNVNIELSAGDGADTILKKINSSEAPVKAVKDPVTGVIMMNTTIPHQIELHEAGDTGILQEMGILTEGGTVTGDGFHPDAALSGGSLFDVVIELRDSLLEGDYDKIATKGLVGIDASLSNILKEMADIGSGGERIKMNMARLDSEKLHYDEWDSRLTDLDITEAATELKMLEVSQKATYQAASKILMPTLLDYLR